MNIGVDESGSFVHSSASDTWNCVAAYAYPETDTRKIRGILSQLKRRHRVGVNDEIKLKKLNENSYLDFLGQLLQLEGTLYVVATDASLNTPERIRHHQKGQAAKIVEHIDLMQFDAAKQGLRELADLINGMPQQLYVQMQSQLYLVLMIINTAILYYVQRRPQTLGNFRWRIDQKNSSKTDYEEAYLQVLPGFLQTASLREPIPMLAEGNYKWFDRFHYPVGEEPTYLQDVYGIETDDADERKLNIGKVVQEDMALVDSKHNQSVQIADLLASGIRRCLRNGFSANHKVSERLGSLMVQSVSRKTPIHLISFGQESSELTREADLSVSQMSRKARSILC